MEYKMKHKHSGMRIFVVIWLGQMVSLIGTAMTRFALLIWTYQQTEQATAVALLGFFSFVPYVLVSPLAGVVVDRFDRRQVMILADMGAGIMTIGLLVLHQQDALQIWHLYLAQAVASFFEAFQLPAYTAVTSTLVAKSQYGRINGMRSAAGAVADIIAPLSAGLVVALIGIGGVMIVDVATFGVAMLALLVVRLPRTDKPAATEASEPFWQELTGGLRFITARRGLVGLLTTYVGINLFAALTYFAILPPMILARSGGSELALASVQGTLGGAALVGGLVMSIWGGPRRKIHGALGFTAVSFLFRRLLVWCGANLTGLAAGSGRFRLFHPAAGRFFPGHLAGEGAAGHAGPGVCRAGRAANGDDAAGLPGRRAAGRPLAGTGHAARQPIGQLAGVAGRHRTRRGHGADVCGNGRTRQPDEPQRVPAA
jgi:DHA3 family macrolide efflux protein-like MFS transporter